ncbi:MAG: hypothetical protein A4S09_06070, partial [Proteobacteria bacterium SG_bin7]
AERRKRKFTPRTLFLSVLHLVSGTNNQGYPRALRKAWNNMGLAGEPVKSSLTKVRGKISYKFFADRFEQLVGSISSQRRTFRDLYIYATDGHETSIPVSDDILKCGFRGCSRINNTETYYPRMYMSQLFDVVNELTIGVTQNAIRNENRDALELLKSTEKNSVVLYDRAYISKALLDAHFERENYFVFRCQRGATFKEIITFYKSSRRQGEWIYRGKKIRLFKVKNPKTKEDLVLATNLPNLKMKNKEIAQLYLRRWSIETSFKDMVQQALGQWHSKSVNGILQELFARLWLLNFARIQLLFENPNNENDWLKPNYKKANLKLLVEFMVDCMPLIIRKKFSEVLKLIHDQIRRTMQS